MHLCPPCRYIRRATVIPVPLACGGKVSGYSSTWSSSTPRPSDVSIAVAFTKQPPSIVDVSKSQKKYRQVVPLKSSWEIYRLIYLRLHSEQMMMVVRTKHCADTVKQTEKILCDQPGKMRPITLRRSHLNKLRILYRQ